MDNECNVSEDHAYKKGQICIGKEQNVVMKYIKKVWIKGMDIAEKLFKFTNQHKFYDESKQENQLQSSNKSYQLNQIDQIKLPYQKKQTFLNKKQSDELKQFCQFPFSKHRLNKIQEQIARKNQILFVQRQKMIKRKINNKNTITMMISSTEGHINIEKLLKNLQEQKERKKEKEKLKISREQFKNFKNDQTLQCQRIKGKKLQEIFKLKQKNQLLSQNIQKQTPKVHQPYQNSTSKVQNKNKTETSYNSQTKTINKNIQSKLFQGDLSTILESSNQANESFLSNQQQKNQQKIQNEKKQSLNKQQIRQNQPIQSNKCQTNNIEEKLKINKLKYNPFLTGTVSTNSSHNKNLENHVINVNDLIQNRKKELFSNTNFLSTINNKNEQKMPSNGLTHQSTFKTNPFLTQALNLSDYNNVNISQTNQCSNIFKGNQINFHQNSSFSNQVQKNKSFFGANQSILPLNIFGKSQTSFLPLTREQNEKFSSKNLIPNLNQFKNSFFKSPSNTFESYPNNDMTSKQIPQFLLNEKNKQLYNSFLNPAAKKNQNFIEKSSSNSLFGNVLNQSCQEDDFDRKTQRISRSGYSGRSTQQRRKNKRQQRIRG